MFGKINKQKTRLCLTITTTYDYITKFLAQTKRVEKAKMADLNLKLAVKIFPTFNGLHKDVTFFLKCIELVYKTLSLKQKLN